MKSVYIVHTPYHLLLALGIANTIDIAKQKHIFIISDYKDAKNYYDSFNTYSKFNNCIVHLYPGVYGENNLLKRVLVLVNNKHLLKKDLKKIGAEFVYIFNDGRIEGQLAANYGNVKKQINTYIEDGAAIYASNIYKKSVFKKAVSKILYGSAYEIVAINGAYTKIDRLYAFYPELIRSELKTKNTIKIDNNIFEELVSYTHHHIDKFCPSYDLNNVNCLIIAPHSDFAISIGVSKVIDFYEKIISMLPRDWNTFVKYHPRERNQDYLGVCNKKNISELPSSIPSEMIWIMLKSSPLYVVIGDISTALMSCRTILDSSIVVISGMKFFGTYNQELHNTFKNMNILCPSEFPEVENIIHSVDKI